MTVKRQERDTRGSLSTKDVDAYRNRSAIENRAFFEQRAAAARILRDESVRPREAVREHPELLIDYATLSRLDKA